MSVALLAGCLGDDDDADDPNDVDDTDDTDPDDPEAAVDEYLAEVGNYDGIQDFTGEEEVTVQNGNVEGIDVQQFVFEPAAIRIDTGTTVVWEWADDQNHSVTDEDGAFDSGVQDSGPFEHTFDEAGVYLYFCQPHRAQNQQGAVVVE